MILFDLIIRFNQLIKSILKIFLFIVDLIFKTLLFCSVNSPCAQKLSIHVRCCFFKSYSSHDDAYNTCLEMDLCDCQFVSIEYNPYQQFSNRKAEAWWAHIPPVPESKPDFDNSE